MSNSSQANPSTWRQRLENPSEFEVSLSYREGSRTARALLYRETKSNKRLPATHNFELKDYTYVYGKI